MRAGDGGGRDSRSRGKLPPPQGLVNVSELGDGKAEKHSVHVRRSHGEVLVLASRAAAGGGGGGGGGAPAAAGEVDDSKVDRQGDRPPGNRGNWLSEARTSRTADPGNKADSSTQKRNGVDASRSKKKAPPGFHEVIFVSRKQRAEGHSNASCRVETF